MTDELTPRFGHSDPDRRPPPPIFVMTVTQEPFDFLLERHGLVPTDDLRLTVANELQRLTPLWLDETVKQIAGKITGAN